MVEAHECTNKKCLGNFNGECRQPYLACDRHMIVGTKEQRHLENLLKSKGKDYFKEYKKYILIERGR